MRSVVSAAGLCCLLSAAALVSPPSRAQVSQNASGQGFDCVLYPSLVTDLGSGATGVLHRVPVDRGDLVRTGDIVAELESGAEEAAVELARIRAESTAEVELRRAGATFAERRRRRSEALSADDIVSRSDIDERETEALIGGIQLRQANENLEIARQELRRAEKLLARRTIRSPIDGVVVERYKAIGELVDDRPVARVARLDPLHVEVIVPVDRIAPIARGVRAEVTLDGVDGAAWTAVVSRVDRVADTASGTYGVRLVLPNPDHSVPAGRRCRLRFVDEAAPLPAALAAAVAADTPKGDAATATVTGSAPLPPTAAAALPDEGPEAPPDVCRWLGPFDDKRRAETLLAALRDADHPGSLIERAGADDIGERVVSVEQPDRDEALALLERMRAAGITDVRLPDADGVRRLELGAFAHAEAAARRVAELTAEGFAVERLPWRRATRVYYLAVRGAADTSWPAAADEPLHEHIVVQDADGESREVGCERFVTR